MPKPLSMKLTAQTAIGFFCVLIGCIYGIYSRDRIFLIMSLLIGLFCLVRNIALYRLIQKQAYRTLSGTCLKREPALLRRTQKIRFADASGLEYNFSLDKTAKLRQGHHYRLYFREDPGIPDNPNPYLSSDFLGFEEIAASEDVK